MVASPRREPMPADLARVMDRPAVRVSGRAQDDGSRLAAIRWGQRQRGWVFVGSFAIGDGRRALDLGDLVGWGFFAFAFITQVTSATDVLRQGSFPIYPSRTAAHLRDPVRWHCCFIFRSFCVLSVIAMAGFRARRDRKSVSWSTAGPITATSTRAKANGSGCSSAARASSGPAGSSPSPVRKSNGPGRTGESTGTRSLHSLGRSTVPGPRPAGSRFPSNQILVEPDDEGVSTPHARARSCSSRPTGSSAAPGPISIPSGIATCSECLVDQEATIDSATEDPSRRYHRRGRDDRARCCYDSSGPMSSRECGLEPGLSGPGTRDSCEQPSELCRSAAFGSEGSC